MLSHSDQWPVFGTKPPPFSKANVTRWRCKRILNIASALHSLLTSSRHGNWSKLSYRTPFCSAVQRPFVYQVMREEKLNQKIYQAWHAPTLTGEAKLTRYTSRKVLANVTRTDFSQYFSSMTSACWTQPGPLVWEVNAAGSALLFQIPLRRVLSVS